MSDRKQIVDIATGSGKDRAWMCMDGQSGTWRLFLYPGGECGDDVDFTLGA